MRVSSSLKMQEIDRISIEEKGFGNLLLMENAGIRLLEESLKYITIENKRIVCIAGAGNNGGDSLVVARQIFSRYKADVNIIILSEKGTEAFNFNLNLCRNLGLNIVNIKENELDASSLIDSADLIFDGISGTGIKGALRGAALDTVNLVNTSHAIKLSIDVPSGIGDSFENGFSAVQADFTFTIGLPKRCLFIPYTRRFCGKIKTIKIGFPEELLNDKFLEPDGVDWILADFDLINEFTPLLNLTDYKNKRGHLAVFAGSHGTTGAAVLCADASIRTSAGLVSLFVDEDIYQICAEKTCSSIMVNTADDNKVSATEKYNAVVIGPGWGEAESRKSLLLKLIKDSRGVLDADALNLLSVLINKENLKINLQNKWVITPHPGEFKRLFPDLDPINQPFESVTKAAEILNCVVLLKGSVSFISSPDKEGYVVDGVFPKLGTAGSGDLLCGIIGGYMATGLEPFKAAVLGALIHLRSAQRCSSEHEWFSSEDLLSYI
ncbi:MAG: NAD(P)H-hydrate dehydratase [Spirochaetales bacterium]|nr:NAD(P)H-hydrate dehydratase [Spirochaetales bacterium]